MTCMGEGDTHRIWVWGAKGCDCLEEWAPPAQSIFLCLMKYSQVKNWDKKDICVKYKSTKQTNVHFGGPGRENSICDD